jgi:signal transduction histidine kinase
MSPRKGDEIDILNSTYKAMKRRIQQQIQDLRENEESRRELLAALSHDLRTPLATLRSHIETLCEKGDTLRAAEQRRLLEVADRSGRNLSHLISQLFELAQLESSDTQPQIERFSLAELVQDTVQEFQLAAASRGISLKAEIDTTLPETEGDISLIQRVLVNLLENSLRVTADGGNIEISLGEDKQNDLLKLSVFDNGPGIAPDKLPFIFKRPHRIKSQIGRSDHAGLGLITVKRILDLHKQPIEIESKLGEGTRFTFKLPAVSLVQ